MHPLPSNTWGSCLQEPPRGRKSLGGEYKGSFQKHKNFFFFAFHECSQNEEKGRMTSAGDGYVHSGSDV